MPFSFTPEQKQTFLRLGLGIALVALLVPCLGQSFSFAGVLLALPAAAVVSVALRHLWTQYVSGSFYTQSSRIT
jgi:predicted PurR-regulated permease PerM